MDPDVTLAQIRELDAEGNSDEAMFLFHALDDWLKSGGFLPKDWERK